MKVNDNLKLWIDDPWLEPWKKTIKERHDRVIMRYLEIAGYHNPISQAVNSHLFYGVHKDSSQNRYFREWAPNATEMYLIGDFSSWKKDDRFRFENIGSGNWELVVKKGIIKHKQLFKWLVVWDGGEGERIPAYATRTVQDPETKLFAAQIWDGEPYVWKHSKPKKPENLLIYEAHIGMSSQEPCVATFESFRKDVLPRIAKLGYNAIQLMAIQEHPYYGSFGYQVSGFYAVSSRFGTPEELKELIDEAHSLKMLVLLDLVHSHAVSNTLEGLASIDGTSTAYFHSGPAGDHPAWGSKCFNYGKGETLHFLLSNCKYWLEEYNFDGFRFDGVTSMIYYDHGLGRSFTDYSQYFDGNQDPDALVYLALANMLIKEINPGSVTIAEEMSGMPGLAAPVKDGGYGFDYRLSMGVADHWIKWIKELRDEDWNVGEIFYQLSSKRVEEKTVSYAECHDQALVGDKTIIFRLLDSEMYTSMNLSSQSITIDRGIALHKMIRLATISLAGNGYLNFMGNEFGHPEWIDFPREGNGWSFHHARRQWSLSTDSNLRYKYLLEFDKKMVSIIKRSHIYRDQPRIIYQHDHRQILIFMRDKYLFAFNFSPVNSYSQLEFAAPAGSYKTVLDTDWKIFGGFQRNDKTISHITNKIGDEEILSLYLPSRSAALYLRAEK